MSYSQKDFMYERKGPWPQPCPVHPWGESPAVVHVPFRENLDWWTFIGSRYLATLPSCIPSFIKGILNPGLKEVTNKKFDWYFNKTLFSKFLTKSLDDIDRNIFKKELLEERDWYIADLEAVKLVNPFKGVYVSGSKTLLYKEHNDYYVYSIYLDKSELVFNKDDGDAWELAKYFVLQGCALASTLVTHPILHFPNDTINAITKTSLPKEHTLFKLLYPHLRFTLTLENAVLNYKSSLLEEKWWMVYAPYPGGPKGLRDLLVEGYKGIKGNASYPPFHYPMGPSKLDSEYGDYLRTYYKVFHKYVSSILAEIPQDDIWVKRWAEYISKHLPSFPNGEEIFKDDNFISAVTTYLFNVTVGHSVDHNSFGGVDKREVPLRIRQEAPTKNIKMKKRSKLCSPIDFMKYDVANKLFYAPFTVTKLINSKYKFKNTKNKNAVKTFKEELKKADTELTKKKINYMKLSKIAASIQF